MSVITRGILRWGLISGLALGGMTLLIGPERVAAGLCQIRTKAQNVVDNVIEDPVALRRQLASLADKYPDRIADVRGEIAEVDHQLTQLARDKEIADRVVAMTTSDLSELKTKIARAEGKRNEGVQQVSIRFEANRFDIPEAYGEAKRINNVRVSYMDRAVHDDTQLNFLSEQKATLTEILSKLESEHATLQTQLWQLERQIDALERNERLIQMTEEQQATLETYKKFGEVGNIGQLEAKLAQMIAESKARLDTMMKRSINYDYESRASHELNTDTGENPFEDPFEGIETNYDANDADFNVDDSVAWLGEPVIID